MQVDSYEFAEPKDIIPELKKEFWDGLASAKWSERKVGHLLVTCCIAHSKRMISLGTSHEKATPMTRFTAVF